MIRDDCWDAGVDCFSDFLDYGCHVVMCIQKKLMQIHQVPGGVKSLKVLIRQPGTVELVESR